MWYDVSMLLVFFVVDVMCVFSYIWVNVYPFLDVTVFGVISLFPSCSNQVAPWMNDDARHAAAVLEAFSECVIQMQRSFYSKCLKWCENTPSGYVCHACHRREIWKIKKATSYNVVARLVHCLSWQNLPICSLLWGAGECFGGNSFLVYAVRILLALASLPWLMFRGLLPGQLSYSSGIIFCSTEWSPPVSEKWSKSR